MNNEHPFIPVTSLSSGLSQNVTPDLYCLCIQVVNVCFIGQVDEPNGWFLECACLCP